MVLPRVASSKSSQRNDGSPLLSTRNLWSSRRKYRAASAGLDAGGM